MLTFCTVVTRSHLMFAEALYRSLLDSQKIFEFYVFVVDGKRSPSKELPYELIFLDEMHKNKFIDMQIYYNPFELCCAIKPSAIQYLIIQKERSKVIFLDSDIMAIGSFSKMEDVLDSHSFSFTPHILKPYPQDGLEPSTLSIINSGIYNGGFWAFNNSDESLQILEWLVKMFENFAFDDPENGMFVDQKFLPMAASLFSKNFRQMDDSGYNIAYWNLHERNLDIKNGIFFSNGTPATFFHFSGYSLSKPTSLTKFDYRKVDANNIVLSLLMMRYQKYLEDGVSLIESGEYQFEKTIGKSFSKNTRRFYFKRRNYQGIFSYRLNLLIYESFRYIANTWKNAFIKF
jgi:lipopolysaccharide biosynthesis glycosyltransferase